MVGGAAIRQHPIPIPAVRCTAMRRQRRGYADVVANAPLVPNELRASCSRGTCGRMAMRSIAGWGAVGGAIATPTQPGGAAHRHAATSAAATQTLSRTRRSYRTNCARPCSRGPCARMAMRSIAGWRAAWRCDCHIPPSPAVQRPRTEQCGALPRACARRCEHRRCGRSAVHATPHPARRCTAPPCGDKRRGYADVVAAVDPYGYRRNAPRWSITAALAKAP